MAKIMEDLSRAATDLPICSVDFSNRRLDTVDLELGGLGWLGCTWIDFPSL